MAKKFSNKNNNELNNYNLLRFGLTISIPVLCKTFRTQFRNNKMISV